MKKIKIYIAGPLFSVAERNFNRALADALKSRIPNCTVSLPQEYAKTIVGQTGFIEHMFDYCVRAMVNSDVVVAILDGPDVDAGTCVEIGYAYAHGKPIIGVRTDFRASEDSGVNLMVSKACAEIIWLRDSSVELNHVVDEILHAVKRLFSPSLEGEVADSTRRGDKGDRVTN